MRKIKTGSVLTCDDLKKVIRKQLCHEVIPNDFDVSYADGASIVQIRTVEDMNELWDNLRKPNNKKTVWCDGLKEVTPEGNKRQRLSADFDDEDILAPCAKKKRQPTQKEEQVQKIADSLKKKHDTNFTPMQYRIWGEMIAGGLHINTDNPPNTTMFARAGGGTPCREKSQQSTAVNLFTEAAAAISSALSPQTPVSASGTCSPAKVIDSRSKLYKQLSDLQNLRSTGVLSQDEYLLEKESIMDLLTKLKT